MKLTVRDKRIKHGWLIRIEQKEKNVIMTVKLFWVDKFKTNDCPTFT